MALFLFGVPELFRGGFLPSGGVICYCYFKCRYFIVFWPFLAFNGKIYLVYGDTNGQSKKRLLNVFLARLNSTTATTITDSFLLTIIRSFSSVYPISLSPLMVLSHLIPKLLSFQNLLRIQKRKATLPIFYL